MNYFEILLAKKLAGSSGGGSIGALVEIATAAGATVEALDEESKVKYSADADNTGAAEMQIKKSGTYTLRAKIKNAGEVNWIYSETDSVTIPEYGGLFDSTLNFITLSLTAPQGSTYTLTDGTTTYTGTSTGEAVTYYLPNTGTWTASCTDGTQSATETVSVTAYTAYTVDLSYVHVYGVIWDKTQPATTLTRTDDAANFANPDPYVADGNHPGSSPFDSFAPWSGMVKETIGGSVLVKIPKFWYKWTSTSSTLELQIANKAVAGFNVSPAHADRGDGKGERDYVYIARYKCSSTDYKSVTGESPKVSITRGAARTAIKALGTGFYQQDFAMFWTTRMLYLVEFANWNSQAAIGYGCGNNSSVQNTGASDSMTYHTGTMQSARTTYGVGVQYRWIEDPWGNVREWCDGIRFSVPPSGSSTSNTGIYMINNPENFSDTAPGTYIGKRPTTSAYISDWSIPTATGFEYALYPSAFYGGEQTYIADVCNYGSGADALNVGGYYSKGQSCGMFSLNGDNSASYSGSYLGARLMYLPPQS